MVSNLKSLVVGSSSGIGLQIATDLCGFCDVVYGISRRSHDLSPNFVHISVDVTCELEFAVALDSLPFSEIDNIVYVAGINEITLIRDLTSYKTKKLFDTNFYPAVQLTSHLAAHKRTLHHSLLFIGSIWSSFGLPGRSVYGASKGALASFCKHSSAELACENILVNCLSPGFTCTPLTSRTISDPKIVRSLNRTATNNLQDVASVSSAALSLLKPQNISITGQEIFVDSGFSAHA